MNKLIISNKNNNRKDEIEFYDITYLYNKNLFIIDINELAKTITDNLITYMEQYGWYDIELDDLDAETYNQLGDIYDALKHKVTMKLKQRNIKYEWK